MGTLRRVRYLGRSDEPWNQAQLAFVAPARANVRGNPMDPKNNPETTETVTEDALVEEELLVEEISIDGMCGVY